MFPRGTELWKEFSLGRRVETRYLRLGDDRTWHFAAYVWDDDGRDATLAPEAGARAVATTAAGSAYDVPARSDCAAKEISSARPLRLTPNIPTRDACGHFPTRAKLRCARKCPRTLVEEIARQSR